MNVQALRGQAALNHDVFPVRVLGLDHATRPHRNAEAFGQGRLSSSASKVKFNFWTFLIDRETWPNRR